MPLADLNEDQLQSLEAAWLEHGQEEWHRYETSDSQNYFHMLFARGYRAGLSDSRLDSTEIEIPVGLDIDGYTSHPALDGIRIDDDPELYLEHENW